MNCFTATGHVKTAPERRTSSTGKLVVYFSLEVEDEIFPGRSRYTVATIDGPADYVLSKIQTGSEIFVQGRLRKQGDVVTIYARQVRAFVR